MLQTSPKVSASAALDIFPPALKSTQGYFRMNIERGKRLVFFGVIQFIKLTFFVCSLFDVLSVAIDNDFYFFIQLNDSLKRFMLLFTCCFGNRKLIVY